MATTVPTQGHRNSKVNSEPGYYGDVMFEVVEVTPAKAAEMLNRNLNNRKLVTPTFMKFAGAMERGEWFFNGETITFDTDGILVNGQHRLRAVMESGITLPLLIVYGLEPVSRETVDIGRSRTLADHMALRGIINYTQVAGCTTLFYRALHKHIPRRTGRYPTHAQQLAFYEQYETIITEGSMWARAAYQHYLKTPPSVLGAAYCLGMMAAPEGQHDEFFAALADGSNLAPDSPILKARDRLIKDATETRRLTRHQETQLSIIIKAFNRWVKGEPAPQVFTWRFANEPFPEVLMYGKPDETIEYLEDEIVYE